MPLRKARRSREQIALFATFDALIRAGKALHPLGTSRTPPGAGETPPTRNGRSQRPVRQLRRRKPSVISSGRPTSLQRSSSRLRMLTSPPTTLKSRRLPEGDCRRRQRRSAERYRWKYASEISAGALWSAASAVRAAARANSQAGAGSLPATGKIAMTASPMYFRTSPPPATTPGTTRSKKALRSSTICSSGSRGRLG